MKPAIQLYEICMYCFSSNEKLDFKPFVIHNKDGHLTIYMIYNFQRQKQTSSSEKDLTKLCVEIRNLPLKILKLRLENAIIEFTCISP